jgi:broad specificity phosphatase PhoE
MVNIYPDVYFVRHGESMANVHYLETLAGGHRDAQLSPTGVVQALEAGAYLDKFEPEFKDAVVVCSVLTRAIETAILLTRTTPKSSRPTIFVIPHIREYKWTSSSNPRSLRRVKKYFRLRYPDDMDRLDFSGVTERDVESINKTSVFREVLRYHETANGTLEMILHTIKVRRGISKKIIVVSHGGFLRRNVSWPKIFGNCSIWYNGRFIYPVSKI